MVQPPPSSTDSAVAHWTTTPPPCEGKTASRVAYLFARLSGMAMDSGSSQPRSCFADATFSPKSTETGPSRHRQTALGQDLVGCTQPGGWRSPSDWQQISHVSAGDGSCDCRRLVFYRVAKG